MHLTPITLAGLIVFTSATAISETTGPLSGAAEITSVPAYLVNSRMPDSLREFETRGEFAAADKWLEDQITSAGDDQKQLYTAERERLRRLKRDYSATAEDILKNLRKEIPKVTTSDLELWRQESAIQWIPVDGETRYFRREPGNLLRFDKRAQAMRKAAKKGSAAKGDPAASSEKFDLNPHLQKVIAAAKDANTSIVLPVTFHVTHTITVKPDVVPPGEIIRCWFPYPLEYRQQQAPRLISANPRTVTFAAPGTLMNTVYMEQPASKAGQPTTFTLEYEYTSAAFYPDLKKPHKTPLPAADKSFLEEQPPHIVFTPELRKLAAQVVGDADEPLEKAFAIWSWLDKNVKWAAEMEYATMPNIVQKVSTCMRGDCGTQALLFVTLCRLSGVPARWQSGWVTKPKDWNMHDWAEFYAPEFGWLPADPSVGRRKSTNPAVRDYMFGHLDSYRMIANLDWGTQFDPPKKFERSDPVDNQRGEVEWSGGNLYYDDWKYDIEVK